MVRIVSDSERSTISKYLLINMNQAKVDYLFGFFNCYVNCSDGIIKAFLFERIIELSHIGKTSYISYIYSLEEYRNKGYIGEIFRVLDSENIANDVIASIIIPRDNYQYDMFYYLGYINVSHINKYEAEVRSNDILPFTYDFDNHLNQQVVLLSEYNTDLLVQFYEECLIKDIHEIRNKKVFAAFLQDFVSNDGAIYGIYASKKLLGYALYDSKNNSIIEIIGDNSSKTTLVNSILAVEGKTSMTVFDGQSNGEERFASMKLYKELEIQDYYLNLLGI